MWEGETDECARLVYGLFDEGVLAKVLFLTAGPSVTVWAGPLSSLSRQPTEGPIQAWHSLLPSFSLPPLSPSLAESFVYSLSPLSGMRWLLGSPLSPPKCFIDELWLLLLFHMSKKVKCRPPWLHFMLLPSKKHKFLPSPRTIPLSFPLFFAYSCTPIFWFCMHTNPHQVGGQAPVCGDWSGGAPSNAGAEGLLLGALRCALIAKSFKQRGSRACGHGYTVISFYFYLRVLFAVRSQEWRRRASQMRP